MAIKLSDARISVTNGVLHVDDNAYDAAKIDRAILTVLTEFADYTGCIVENKTVSTTAHTATIDLTSGTGLSALLPAFLISVRIGYAIVRRADDDWMHRRLNAYSATEGKPQYYAYETPTSVHLLPVPDAIYALNLTVQSPLTQFQPGAPGSTAINIPDRYLRLGLWTGCAALLVYGEETDNPWPVKGWDLYLAYRDEIRAKASMEAGMVLPPVWTPKLHEMAQRMKAAA